MKTFIQKGDIIVFDNKHKIYCGDSTLKESYSFMGDEKASLCFTSPPYNCGANNYGSNRAQAQKYIFDSQNIINKTVKYYGDNDNKTQNDYLDLLLKTSNNALEHSKYLFYNVSHLAGNKISLIDYTYLMKEKYVDTMIWKKTTSMPLIEKNILNSDFEYIYIYTNIKNNGKHIRIGPEWMGTKSNVVEINRNMKNKYAEIHRALMPIELCDYIITNFTNENDIVLDNFSGLATNMISCMKNNRIYRGIELEPLYCQETINRYLEYKTNDYDIKIIRNGKEILFNEFKHEILHEFNLFTI